jgi:threonine dehydratase
VIPLAEIEAARERLAGSIVRTPLVRLELEEAPAEIYLKLENLQPIGAFKLRGAGNALLLASPEELEQGVWTASAGNMAQGLAWWARRLGVHCTVVLPDTAPETKIAALRRLGADMIPVTFDEWHEVFRTRTFEGLEGLHVHAFSDEAVMAGNGTIALEILEDLPEVDAIVAPYGGGGLSCGIASAVRALAPSCKVLAAEVATAAPLAPSLEAGRPVKVDYTPSFVDGIGSPEVFPEMFELARELLDGALVAELAEVEDAVRLLAERARVVAEGAGATSVALARNGAAGSGKVVCVVSGGNIDAAKLSAILSGREPA